MSNVHLQLYNIIFYLPTLDSTLPFSNLADVFHFSFSFVDKTGDIFHGFKRLSDRFIVFMGLMSVLEKFLENNNKNNRYLE